MGKGSRKREAKLASALNATRQQLALTHLRAYEAAKMSRRTEDWWTNNAGPNADLRLSWQRIVQRHQDLVDSDPWASKAISVVVANWIGDGIIGRPVGPGASKRYGDGFRDWAESTDCDFYGQLNFYGLQALIARTVAVRGSCLIRKRYNPALVAKGLCPLQLQVLEPDWLDVTKDDGARIRFGKEYDQDGRLLQYHIRHYHPGESIWTVVNIGSTPIPASEICHVYDIRRPGQSMGVPFGVTALLKLKDVSDRDSAQLLKDKLAACFMAFITDPEGQPQLQIAPINTNSPQSQPTLLDKLEPGIVELLQPGQDIKFATPPGSGDYVAVQNYHLKGIAVAYEITYESLTGDLSQVNFSSGRMGHIEMRRAVSRWRWSIIIPQALQPIAGWYRDTAAAAGMGRGTARFEWTPPVAVMVNPAQEIPALIDLVKAGAMSLSELQRMLGYIPELVLQELAQDIKSARAAGLSLAVDGAAAFGKPVDSRKAAPDASPPDSLQSPPG